MAGNNRSLMVKGYIMTLLGGLLWSVGGACGQVIFRDCGVISDWLVPIRLFIGGLITLSAAAIAGNKPMAILRHKEAWPSLLVFSLLGSAALSTAVASRKQSRGRQKDQHDPFHLLPPTPRFRGYQKFLRDYTTPISKNQPY